ncbi:uncharacterized protein K02A2.6-like [Octopus bimaculoides]|uniref:uncharacterized protein K02A2.6-like n=1 Tax=Octopus bimaculoides TaxID=37653 RepID=UPI00071E087D|nr:uncharacterized protein K02A2.6-like [Octopus bimaculoides]|eukprot:XP_014783310.1 PREDICTED: uncharacterized protein K02A2.6-like [Octopus bimaculoides]
MASILVKKDKIYKMCADSLTGLNDYLLEHNYPLPSPEEVFSKLNGGKIFLKLDLSEAYLQIEVEEDCTHLLTINIHHRLYKFKWFPFGVKAEPAIFQQVMDAMLNDCDFAIAYLNDMLIKSESVEQHVEHIKKSVRKNK